MNGHPPANIHTALQAERSQVRFPMLSFEFFIDEVLAADSTPNGNEYQEYIFEDKFGRDVRLTTLYFHVPIVMKSGSLKLLET